MELSGVTLWIVWNTYLSFKQKHLVLFHSFKKLQICFSKDNLKTFLRLRVFNLFYESRWINYFQGSWFPRVELVCCFSKLWWLKISLFFSIYILYFLKKPYREDEEKISDCKIYRCQYMQQREKWIYISNIYVICFIFIYQTKYIR